MYIGLDSPVVSHEVMTTTDEQTPPLPCPSPTGNYITTSYSWLFQIDRECRQKTVQFHKIPQPEKDWQCTKLCAYMVVLGHPWDSIIFHSLGKLGQTSHIHRKALKNT